MQECLKVCILETESGMFVAGMFIVYIFSRNLSETLWNSMKLSLCVRLFYFGSRFADCKT